MALAADASARRAGCSKEAVLYRTRQAATIVTSALLALGLVVGVDALLRWRWLELDLTAHLWASGVIYAAYAGVVGLAVALAVSVERTITTSFRTSKLGLPACAAKAHTDADHNSGRSGRFTAALP